jgi:hypothetical protein
VRSSTRTALALDARVCWGESNHPWPILVPQRRSIRKCASCVSSRLGHVPNTCHRDKALFYTPPPRAAKALVGYTSLHPGFRARQCAASARLFRAAIQVTALHAQWHQCTRAPRRRDRGCAPVKRRLLWLKSPSSLDRCEMLNSIFGQFFRAQGTHKPTKWFIG